jgi:hypothetical protein
MHSLTIPAPPESIIEGDPNFAELRRHHSAFRAGVSITLGAAVAMGAEIARLRAVVQPAEGRPKKTGNIVASFQETPWRDLVKTHAAVDHETARRAEKVAADLRQHLEGKRDQLSRRARALIDDPTQIASFDDYFCLSQVVGTIYDADTWHGILVEAGVIRRPIGPRSGGSDPDPIDPPKRLSLAVEARAVALGLLAKFRELTTHREQWRKRLAALPVESTGDPNEPSLSDLRDAISDRLLEIDEIILRKQSAR